jgi:hypothetical protein
MNLELGFILQYSLLDLGFVHFINGPLLKTTTKHAIIYDIVINCLV